MQIIHQNLRIRTPFTVVHFVFQDLDVSLVKKVKNRENSKILNIKLETLRKGNRGHMNIFTSSDGAY